MAWHQGADEAECDNDEQEAWMLLPTRVLHDFFRAAAQNAPPGAAAFPGRERLNVACKRPDAWKKLMVPLRALDIIETGRNTTLRRGWTFEAALQKLQQIKLERLLAAAKRPASRRVAVIPRSRQRKQANPRRARPSSFY